MPLPKATTPIQRHSALAPLSRDHHTALLLARGVQAGAKRALRLDLPTESRALADHVRTLFERELLPHFAAEEEVIVVGLAHLDPQLDALGRQVVLEHEELRAIAETLGDAALSVPEVDALLDRFGKLLESHVRQEERVVYTRVQELLDEPALAALGVELSRCRDANAVR